MDTIAYEPTDLKPIADEKKRPPPGETGADHDPRSTCGQVTTRRLAHWSCIVAVEWGYKEPQQ